MANTIEIKVPDIGGNHDVPVIEVLVKAGDTVAKEQSLITLESDKATMEIPSSAAGVIKEVKLKVGDEVSGGQAGHLLEPGEGQVVAVPQRCQGHHDAQPGGCVDDRVEGGVAHEIFAAGRGPFSQTWRADISR